MVTNYKANLLIVKLTYSYQDHFKNLKSNKYNKDQIYKIVILLKIGQRMIMLHNLKNGEI